MEETVYIHALRKRIPFEEYKQLVYEEGCAYKLNDGNYQKCVKMSWDKRPEVEQVCIVHNAGVTTQIMFNANGLPTPLLDMANDMASGKTKKIPVEEYEAIKQRIFDFAVTLRANNSQD